MISFPTMLLRLVLALLLGACIGVERQIHVQAAGLRTNALVALGSCLFMIISAYGFNSFLGIAHIQVDPSRIASYVVAGIGFLGAGTIFRSSAGEKVKGLTTAAAIWIVAALGLACGVGLLLEAIATTVLTLIILVGLRFIEEFFWGPKQLPMQHIHLEATTITGQFIEAIYDICTRNTVSIDKLSMHKEQDRTTIELGCQVKDTAALVRTIGELHTLPGIQTAYIDLQADSHARAIMMHLDEDKPELSAH